MPCSRSAREQELVGDRAAERGDAAAAQIGERAKPVAIGVAHREHLAELGSTGSLAASAARRAGRVLDAAQADVEVAARRRLVERGERRPGRTAAVRPSSRAISSAISTSKPTQLLRIGRVGLDERRAALGVAAPAQDWRRGLRGERLVEDQQSEQPARDSHCLPLERAQTGRARRHVRTRSGGRRLPRRNGSRHLTQSIRSLFRSCVKCAGATAARDRAADRRSPGGRPPAAPR